MVEMVEMLSYLKMYIVNDKNKRDILVPKHIEYYG